MKKVFYIVLLSLSLVACNFNNNSKDDYQQSLTVVSSTENKSSTLRYTTPKDAAPEIARTFVKNSFASDCKFEQDVVLENTMVSNRYQVMQKFNSNKQGVELSYVYKIYIQYFDGDVNNVSSWEFSQLIVEEMNNGIQTYFKGNLDSRIKKSVGVGTTVDFAGIEFKIIDVRLGTSISFSHKGKLSRKQLATALKEMHDTYKYDVYHIYRDNNLDEDYFSWQASSNLSAVYDFENDKIYVTLDDYVNGKAAM